MRTFVFRLAAAASLLMLAACTQAPAPAADTRAADEKALRDLDAASLTAWNNKNAEMIASFYTDDATIAIPGAPLIQGKTALQSGLKDTLADPNFKLSFSPNSVETAGGVLGYVRGTYMVSMTDPRTKKSSDENGNYLIVYKKQADGSWKIINDFATPAAPPPPSAQSK
jgi:uncharacterized protein (TIGR02246 family)